MADNVKAGNPQLSTDTTIGLNDIGITRDESSKKGHLKNNVAVQHLNSKRKDGKRVSFRSPELDYSLCRNIYKRGHLKKICSASEQQEKGRKKSQPQRYL